MSNPRFLGFRVNGICPVGDARYPAAVSDLFEVYRAAIDCCVALESAGWTEVSCCECRDDESIPIDWRAAVPA